MRWADPGWFLLLLALVPLPWLVERRRPRLAWPTLDGFPDVGPSAWLARGIAAIVPTLRTLMIVALVAALARPQTVAGRSRIAAQGVAILVAIDHSSSMKAQDFPSEDGPLVRLDAARRTLRDFVARRPDDLIGLVGFANYPDLLCPPTLDHRYLLDTVNAVRTARPGDDGTNLGDAIIWSLEALKGLTPKRKVLILLTDGRNSPAVPRPTDPREAARIARGLGVTLHTIAVGAGGSQVRMVEPRTGLPISTEVEGPDFELLKQLAELGGGRPFVASDRRGLEEVFAAIDALETSPVRGEVRTRYHEWYAVGVAVALSLLMVERGLVSRRLRQLP
ncbi:MAG: VWA domain-containing protein [Isosphaeraceae bacterium]